MYITQVHDGSRFEFSKICIPTILLQYYGHVLYNIIHTYYIVYTRLDSKSKRHIDAYCYLLPNIIREKKRYKFYPIPIINCGRVRFYFIRRSVLWEIMMVAKIIIRRSMCSTACLPYVQVVGTTLSVNAHRTFGYLSIMQRRRPVRASGQHYKIKNENNKKKPRLSFNSAVAAVRQVRARINTNARNRSGIYVSAHILSTYTCVGNNIYLSSLP